jgi:hypothetical protein
MRRSVRLVLTLLAAPMAVLVAANGSAEMRNRTRKDGTVEFSNQPGGGRRGSASPGAKPADSGSRSDSPASVGGTFWSRERADGVVEFTNQRPAGANWKVWLKTGPGKAGALRGRTDRVPARDRSAVRYSRYDQDIHDQQAYYGIPEAFIRAVIKVESDYDPRVVSSVGAQGLMQLMPETGRLMGVTDPFDGRQGIMGGARYLQLLARRFCRTPARDTGDDGGATNRDLVCSDAEIIKVIAGYHAGPGAVEKYGGMPPYETTRLYVSMVLRRFEEYRGGPAAHAGAFQTER